jgi:hypothetical protein
VGRAVGIDDHRRRDLDHPRVRAARSLSARPRLAGAASQRRAPAIHPVARVDRVASAPDDVTQQRDTRDNRHDDVRTGNPANALGLALPFPTAAGSDFDGSRTANDDVVIAIATTPPDPRARAKET